MAEQDKTARISTTKPNNVNGVTDVPVTPKRKVTYIFQCITAASVKLPYAVAVNGKVLADYAAKVERVDSGVRKKKGQTIYTPGSFTVHVDAGSTVALYLNSDAAPRYRTQPVYEVRADERDVIVRITEVERKSMASDKPSGPTQVAAGKDGRVIDEYTAPLTGDIWMRVSHKYTLTEAKALIPVESRNEIRDAVLKIYDGSLKESLKLSLVNENGGRKALTIEFENADNPRDNISNFEMYRDGLPRVHPQAWVAVIEAALKAGVSEVKTSSAWRPMLGSIAHRVGLSLDVTYLDAINLNRRELLPHLYAGRIPDTANVSEEEKRLFAEMQKAEADSKAAKAALKALQDEQNSLAKLKKVSPAKVNPLREAALPDEIKAATALSEAKDRESGVAKKRWTEERDKNEPVAVKTFRTELSRCKCIKQLFDPWYMDINTRDNQSATDNLQNDSNSQLHANHLHLMVFDPILATT